MHSSVQHEWTSLNCISKLNSVNSQLLDDFLSEEREPETRAMLLAALDLPPPMVVKEFTFNRFDLRLHFEDRHVIIFDILTVGPEGEYRLSFDDFAKALRSERSLMSDLTQKYALAAEAYGQAIESGDGESETHFRAIEEAFIELRRMGQPGLVAVASLLVSDHAGVRLWSAAHLLNYPEYGSLLVLERLKRSPSVLALTAQITLEQWREGKLKY